MMAAGQTHHAKHTIRPSSINERGRQKIFYHCNQCSRKWVSRVFYTSLNSALNAMKLCYNCGAEVFTQVNPSDNNVSVRSEILINNCAEDSKGAIFVWEHINGIPILFDTGAEISVISTNHCPMFKNLPPSIVTNLRGVTGQKISTLGNCRYPLDLGFSKVLCHDFVVVDLRLPYALLGLDFIKENGVILDPKSEAAYLSNSCDCVQLSTFSQLTSLNEKLDYGENILSFFKSLSVKRIAVKSGDKAECAIKAEEECFNILKSFPELPSEPDYNRPPKHSFTLDIDLIDPSPIMQRPRRFSESDKILINEHMEDLIRRGAVTEGSSSYVSPIVLVPKKNGKTRVCIDYTRLNAQTMPINYPIPLIRDLSLRLKGHHRWYSVLDLREAYYSLPLTKRASERAAIIT